MAALNSQTLPGRSKAQIAPHPAERVDPTYADKMGHTLREARRRAGLSLRALALLAATSHATLSAYEQGRKTPSVVTFLRIIEACNFDIDFALTPRIRHADGMARGDELAQVLILAEQFPARVQPNLDLPIFPGRA